MRRTAKKKKRACRKKRRGVNPLKRGSIFGAYDPWKGTIFSKGFRKAAPLEAPDLPPVEGTKEASRIPPVRGKLAPGCLIKRITKEKRFFRSKTPREWMREVGSFTKWLEKWRKKDEKIPWLVAEGKRAEELAGRCRQSRLPAQLMELPVNARIPEMKRLMQFGSSGDKKTQLPDVRAENNGIQFRWAKKDDESSQFGSHKELLKWQTLYDIWMRQLNSKERPEWMVSVKQHRLEQKRAVAKHEREVKERLASYREAERKNAARRKLIIKRLTPLLGRKATKQDASEYVEQDRVREWQRKGIKATVAGKSPPTPMPPLTLEEFAAFKKGGPKAAEKARAGGQTEEDKKRAEQDERMKAVLLSIGEQARKPLEKMLGREPTSMEVSKVVLSALAKSKREGRETFSVKVGVRKGKLVLPK